MAVKSNKGDSSLKKNNPPKSVEVTKSSAKIKKQAEEDSIDFEDDEKTTKAGKKTPSVISGYDAEEEGISTKKCEEDEEDWDPDFDEFDLPKSSKKVSFGKKEAKDNEDEFKVDEEFEDYFNNSTKKKYNDADEDY